MKVSVLFQTVKCSKLLDDHNIFVNGQALEYLACVRVLLIPYYKLCLYMSDDILCVSL